MTLNPGGGGSTSGKRVRRVLILIVWNTAFIVIGLTLIGVVGEFYFRVKMPFTHISIPSYFDPEMGIIRKPNSQMYVTNNLDYWTVSRVNSIGFLGREPTSPERAAATCHITVIGDSYVEAKEVSASERFHVRLEEMAAQKLSHLDITVSAFGRGNTGQINQLPYYDKYAQVLNPKLIVLVFYNNDFWDNSRFLSAMYKGYHPYHMPFVTAERTEDETIRLRPPDPEYLRMPGPEVMPSWWQNVAEVTRFAKWIEAEMSTSALFTEPDPWMLEWKKQLKEFPVYETLPPEWWPSNRFKAYDIFDEDNLPLFYEENLDFTEFALDEFKRRADRDDAALIILSTHRMGAEGDLIFDRLETMAEAREIPVISQFDYIIHSEGRVEDANFRHDLHWNTTGHRWAAEALLEYLAQNQGVCDRRDDIDASS